MAEITAEHISKTIETLHTLADVSIAVHNSEIVVILGPSGCGKSTLLNIISGLLKPDSGTVRLNGEDWTGRTGRTSYMQQKDLLLDSRSILDNVSIPLLLKGVNKRDARRLAGSHLADFGLEGFAHYYPRQLSGGMRQRAALLRTYLFSSDILLLDEPFAALDAITRRKMQLWLLKLQNRYQSAILFVTHDIEEALMIADRIYVLSKRPAHIQLELSINKTSSYAQNFKIKKEILTLLEEGTDE